MIKNLKIAVIGARGLVGQEMLKGIEELIPEIDHRNLLFVGTAKGDRVTSLRFRGVPIEVITMEALMKKDFEIVLMSAGDDVSKKWTPLLLQKGAWVIDNSSAFRMDKDVPLFLPWHHNWKPSIEKKLLPVPNCVAVMLATALSPLMKLQPTSISITALQSVSGAGSSGIDALGFEQRNSGRYPGSPFLFRTAGNIQSAAKFNSKRTQFNEEELKAILELPKIIGQPLNMSIRSFRVPVFYGHFADIVIQFPKEVFYRRVAGALRAGNNLIYESKNMTSGDVIGQNYALVWNLIKTNIAVPNISTFAFSVASDNLRHGAAYPAVLMLSKIVTKFFSS